MFEFITKLSVNKGIQIAVMVFGNIIAPYWFLFHFRPSIVAGDEIIKQTIFCLSIAVPLTLLGFAIHILFNAKVLAIENGYTTSQPVDESKLSDERRALRNEIINQTVFEALTKGSISTAAALYIPVIVSAFMVVSFDSAKWIILGSYLGTIYSGIKKIQKAKWEKKMKNIKNVDKHAEESLSQ